jgi:hypothetical protein
MLELLMAPAIMSLVVSGAYAMNAPAWSKQPPKPPAKKKIVPDDYKDKIDDIFKDLQDTASQYGEEAPPNYLIMRLSDAIMRAVKKFPAVDDPQKFLPDDYEDKIAGIFTRMYLSAANNPGVSTKLLVRDLHRDVTELIEGWK